MGADIKKMIVLAKQAMNNGFAIYSNYRVGCCLHSEDGKYYHGGNVEFSSYSLCMCAETSAIGNLMLDGVRKITDVVIVNHLNTACSPCGACRQRLSEFATDPMNIYLCNDDGIIKQYTLDELLPHQFNKNTMEG